MLNINTTTKTVSLDLTTGTFEFSDDNINIYPNLVSDNLKISGLNSPTEAKIYKTNGKLVLTKNLNDGLGEISVSELSTDVYVI